MIALIIYFETYKTEMKFFLFWLNTSNKGKEKILVKAWLLFWALHFMYTIGSKHRVSVSGGGNGNPLATIPGKLFRSLYGISKFI